MVSLVGLPEGWIGEGATGELNCLSGGLRSVGIWMVELKKGIQIRRYVTYLLINRDLCLQEDVARRVTDHDLVGAGSDAPAVADYIPVGE